MPMATANTDRISRERNSPKCSVKVIASSAAGSCETLFFLPKGNFMRLRLQLDRTAESRHLWEHLRYEQWTEMFLISAFQVHLSVA